MRIGKVVLGFLLFCIGIGCILWPKAEGERRETEMEEMVTEFISADETVYPALKTAMEQYNEELRMNGQENLNSSDVLESSAICVEDYGVENGMVGVLEIPSIAVSLPVYLGASNENLNKGVAVLGQTSMPVGGTGTNCVIAGHRGYRGGTYLRYLPDVEIGEEIILTNLWETMHYRVTDKKIIAPDDIGDIFLEEGKDRLTLLTCHPYAGGGKERYLVICERIEGECE